MKVLPSRGAARHVASASRRRAARFKPSTPESLESRSLLSAGPLGMNVDISPYASYVNWLQTVGNWGAIPGRSDPMVFNASGDPESDAVLVFDYRVNQAPWNGPDPNAVTPPLSGTYHLSFDGQATIQVEYPGFSTPFAIQNQAYNAATNTATADLVVSAGNTADFFGIDFVNTQATPTSATNTGISNAKLIRPGYAADSTQLYSNEFLAALKPYSVLRYLGPDNGNGQPYMNGNTLVTVDAPQVDQTGTPWEYLVALANQTNTDMWINIPQGATNAYVTALAGIIKDGGTVGGVAYPGLNSNLKIYLEYSNEVWGGIPPNETYQQAAVQNSASNMPLSTFPSNLNIYNNVDGTTTTDVNIAVGRRYLERTNDISRLFQAVLGSDPSHQKIRPVLGWQENNFAFYSTSLDWFEHFFGPAGAAFYGIGNADYWNPTDYSSVDAVISSLAAQETSYAIPNTIGYTTLSTYYGLKDVSYEGGPSISGDGNTASGQNALAASRDPRIEQIIYQHYINYYADGGDVAGYFDGPFGTWSPSNEWDAAELAQYGNPSASPKYRGTVDVASAAPVAVTAGVHVSANVPTSFNASSDNVGDNFGQPSAGEKAYWLLNISSAGSYDLRVATAANGASPAQVEVYLDDKQVGGVITLPASGLIDLGNLALSAGLETLSIYVVSAPGKTPVQPTSFTLVPPSSSHASAAFLKDDATTQGNWRGTYGGQGFDIAGDAAATNPSLPSYATASPPGQDVYNFGAASASGDARALQDAANDGDRTKALWYGGSFDIDVNLTDGRSHAVALYLADYDQYQGGRSERVDVVDAATGTVLNSQTVANFSGGQYLVYTITGSVILRVTNVSTVAGSNAVASGLFLDSPPMATGSAAFVKDDATTQGNWRGAYGGQGYDIAGDAAATNPSLPSYATVALAGQSAYNFGAASASGDARALQDAANDGDRTKALWYGSAFSINVAITDGQSHTVSLYLADYDQYQGGRSERVNVLDAATGAVLDSRTVSNFSGGQYLVYTLSGSLTIRVTSTNPGSNAVASALFFGGPPVATGSAAFVKDDATTQGNWRGAYGGQGYDIAGDAAATNPSLPSYATVALAGQSAYNFGAASASGDARALQDAANDGDRTKALWYGSAFSINVAITDGQSHTVSLYLADYDQYQGGRSERVDVLDAATGAVLDSRTVSNFSGGQYLVYTLSGSLTIRVTSTNPGSNAVASALFFGGPPISLNRDFPDEG